MQRKSYDIASTTVSEIEIIKAFVDIKYPRRPAALDSDIICLIIWHKLNVYVLLD
jgi:hypothetical protein